MKLKNQSLRKKSEELIKRAGDWEAAYHYGRELNEAGLLIQEMARQMKNLQEKVGSQSEYIKSLNQKLEIQSEYIKVQNEKLNPKWIPFTAKKSAEENGLRHKRNISFDCELPDNGQKILVSDGKTVWLDMFLEEDEYYLGSGVPLADGNIAWMPLPEVWDRS